MAIDQILKRKRGRPDGSHSTKKNKMDEKRELVMQRMALLDSSSSSESEKDDVIDLTLAEMFSPHGAQQPVVVDCDDTNSTVKAVPLKIIRPSREDNEQIKFPGVLQTCNAPSTGLTNTTKESAVNSQKIHLSVQDNCKAAMDRASEVQAKLPKEHPSFIKNMLQSHVVRGFWLGLPSDFCHKHLPRHDTEIMLEDEDGYSYGTTYLGAKQGLSAGWRGFSTKHGIRVGDVAVFQLVRSTKFKVYIIRANNLTAPDEACKKRKTSSESKENSDDKKHEKDSKVVKIIDLLEDPKVTGVGCPKDPKFAGVNGKIKKDPKVTGVNSEVAHNDSNNLASEAIEGIRFSDSDVDFDNVTSFSNFNIVVDNLVIDCRFPAQLRKTYYELCCSQKSFLHKHLLKQLNLTLIVGVIMETVSIAEGIRACSTRASSPKDFLIWKNTLESFELLGMNVDFLLKRVNSLLALRAHQSVNLMECEKYEEIKLERARAGEKMEALESTLSSLKDALKKMDVEMTEMESSARKSEQALHQLATAPW